METRRALRMATFATVLLFLSLPSFAIADGDDSYAELAACVVPEKLRTALSLLPDLDEDTGPGEVKALRVSLLEAREQLDVFSFAFPNRTRAAEPEADATVLTAWGRIKVAIGEILREIIDWIHKHLAGSGVRGPGAGGLQAAAAARQQGREQQAVQHQGQQEGQQEEGQPEEGQEGAGEAEVGRRRRKERDLWYAVRRDLDQGYEVIGDFQDLDHSLVEYNDTDLQQKRDVCLDWKRRICHNSATDHYLDFVSTTLHPDELYTHKHSSKLFWGFHGLTPDTALSGIQNLALMMRSGQLAQLLAWYPAVMALQPDDLLQEPGHTTFHNFRKLIRSILAVLGEFPELLGPGRRTAAAAAATAANTAQAQAGAARRALSRSSSSGRSGSSSSSARPGGLQLQLQRGGVSEPCDTDAALKALQRLYHDLGQTNNKVFAYQFYSSRGDEWAAEAAAAHEEVAEGWQDNLAFMASAQIDAMARCIAATLPRA